MHDLIIIGSGPAGLSAAVYAGRAELDTVVLEQSAVSGGQILNTYEVDNYLGMPGINGYDMGIKFREHADKQGCKFVEAKVESVERLCADSGQEQQPSRASGRKGKGGQDEKQPEGGSELTAAGNAECEAGFLVRTELEEYRARTLIIASGASHARLNVPGEERLIGAGVSYCATCDGAFFRGKTVAVVGGGDVAVEDAIFLARLCKKVYVIHRRDELRAAAVLQKALLELENAVPVWDTVVERIEGAERVEKLLVRNVKNNQTSELQADGVFVAVGLRPNTELFKEIVPCDEQGYMIAGEDCATQVPGIFAAGDVRTKKLRQIITAVADGACAVAEVQHYLLSAGKR